MTFKNIESKEELDKIVAELNVSEAFLKEVYYRTKSYFDEESTRYPDMIGDLNIFILSSDIQFNGIEFLCEQVDVFKMYTNYEIELSCIFSDTEVELKFNGGLGFVKCRRLKYRYLQEPFLGDKYKYSSSGCFELKE